MHKIKDIKGYEGLYAVTDFGEVWSYRSKKYLKPEKNKSGYLMVFLNKEGKAKMKTIHRLVAEAFIPNPDNLPCVNHKDEVKTNNVWTNLEWVSYSTNLTYGTFRERRQRTLEERGSIYAGRKVEQYDKKTGCYLNSYDNLHIAAKTANVSISHLWECLNGKKHRKTIGGFVWRYAD